jgi:hypothetical protein
MDDETLVRTVLAVAETLVEFLEGEHLNQPLNLLLGRGLGDGMEVVHGGLVALTETKLRPTVAVPKPRGEGSVPLRVGSGHLRDGN